MKLTSFSISAILSKIPILFSYNLKQKQRKINKKTKHPQTPLLYHSKWRPKGRLSLTSYMKYPHHTAGHLVFGGAKAGKIQKFLRTPEK